jgi:hypothetical protein
MDNVEEFTSKTFNYYSLNLGINVEHFTNVHMQNGLTKSYGFPFA